MIHAFKSSNIKMTVGRLCLSYRFWKLVSLKSSNSIVVYRSAASFICDEYRGYHRIK